jgi:hypothetical protein
MQSIRENDFECLASTGVKSPEKAKIRRAVALNSSVEPTLRWRHLAIEEFEQRLGFGEDIQFRRELATIGSSRAPITMSEHHATSRYITSEGANADTTTVCRKKEGD